MKLAEMRKAGNLPPPREHKPEKVPPSIAKQQEMKQAAAARTVENQI